MFWKRILIVSFQSASESTGSGLRAFFRKASRDWPNAKLDHQGAANPGKNKLSLKPRKSDAVPKRASSQLLSNLRWFLRAPSRALACPSLPGNAGIMPAKTTRFESRQWVATIAFLAVREESYCPRCTKKTHSLFYFDLSNGKSPGHEKSATIRSQGLLPKPGEFNKNS